jgi:hypothetical protein
MPVIVVIEGGLGKWQYSDERLQNLSGPFKINRFHGAAFVSGPEILYNQYLIRLLLTILI